MADVTVIVPVLGRPQNAKPFMESISAVRVLAVVSGDDDHKAWQDVGADVLMVDKVSFACKVNAGSKATDTPWIFICGDDVRFEPDWWTQILQFIGGRDLKVIGTNDASGSAADFSPHIAIRRDYIDEVGASWDGPGIVCHEGYRHNYVDNEIIAAAKQRGVWAMCRTSVVEHLHPAWGKGEDDDTYVLGAASAEADGRLFEARARRYL